MTTTARFEFLNFDALHEKNIKKLLISGHRIGIDITDTRRNGGTVVRSIGENFSGEPTSTKN